MAPNPTNQHCMLPVCPHMVPTYERCTRFELRSLWLKPMKRPSPITRTTVRIMCVSAVPTDMKTWRYQWQTHTLTHTTTRLHHYTTASPHHHTTTPPHHGFNPNTHTLTNTIAITRPHSPHDHTTIRPYDHTTIRPYAHNAAHTRTRPHDHTTTPARRTHTIAHTHCRISVMLTNSGTRPSIPSAYRYQ
jgi:hypothetical protein